MNFSPIEFKQLTVNLQLTTHINRKNENKPKHRKVNSLYYLSHD
jgi:hypothetical protein